MTSSHLSSRIGSEIDWFKQKFMRHINHQDGNGVSSIDLATAENWLIRSDLLPMILKAANDFSADDLSYASGLGGTQALLEATSGYFNHFFAPKVIVRPEHVVTSAGASSLLDTLLHCICEEGDGILVESPMWGSFEISCVMRNGVELIKVPVPSQTPSQEEYLGWFELAIQNASCKVRAILFCNPHNPRGQLYSRDLIEAMVRFCEKKNLHFISDEIYGLTTFAKQPLGAQMGDIREPVVTSFTSVLSLDLSKLCVDASRVHCLYSISKDLGSSGVRVGFLVSQSNPELRFALAILNNAKVSTISSVITARLFTNLDLIDTVIRCNIQRLRAAASVVVDFLTFYQVTFYRPIAGVFVWARLGGHDSTWESEEAATRKLTTAGVFVVAGADYSETQPGWVRLTFAIPRDQLIEALRRVEKALDFTKAWQPPAIVY